MSRYIISPAASRDLNEIVNYFVSRNIEAGERLIEEFNQKCKKLVNPNIERSYAEIVALTPGSTFRWLCYPLSRQGRLPGNCTNNQWLSRFRLIIFQSQMVSRMRRSPPYFL